LTIEDSIFEVKTMAGDKHLATEDFFNRFVYFCMHDLRRKSCGKERARMELAAWAAL
jgi:hypothetical protein